MSLRTVWNTVPGLCNVNWYIFAYPTKMVLRFADGSKIIECQKYGGQQGNSLTMIQLILNEKVMSDMIDIIAVKLLPSYKIDVNKSYADDQNKGGSMKSCLLNYFLKEKVAKKYGGKYNQKKSFM